MFLPSSSFPELLTIIPCRKLIPFGIDFCFNTTSSAFPAVIIVQRCFSLLLVVMVRLFLLFYVKHPSFADFEIFSVDSQLCRNFYCHQLTHYFIVDTANPNCLFPITYFRILCRFTLKSLVIPWTILQFGFIFPPILVTRFKSIIFPTHSMIPLYFSFSNKFQSFTFSKRSYLS